MDSISLFLIQNDNWENSGRSTRWQTQLIFNDDSQSIWMNEWVNFFNEEEFCKANWKHFSTVLFLNLFRSFFPSFEVGFGKRTLVSTLRSIIQIIRHLFKSLIFSYLLLVTCLPMFSCRFGSYLFKIKCLGVFRKTRRSPIHFINQFKWISFLREKKWIFIFRHNFIQWWIFSQNYEK